MMNMDEILRYRVRPWVFKFVFCGASYLFAYRHVLAPAAYRRQSRKPFDIKNTRPVFQRLQKLWAGRVKNLVADNQWAFGSGDSRDSVHLSVRRRIFCAPEHFRLKNRKYTVRPCSEYNVCPFCFSRRARWLYRKARAFIQGLPDKKKPGVHLSCRVSQYFVPANGFSAQSLWHADAQIASIVRLRKRLTIERAKYKEMRRTVSSTSLGSAWSVVVNPVDNGWQVETRLFLMTEQPPTVFVKTRRAKTSALKRGRAHQKTDLDTVLAPFVVYPKGFLYSYQELAVVMLHARQGLRLYNTTGCLIGERPNGKQAKCSSHGRPAPPAVFE